MEFEDEAFVVGVRAFGESGAIAEFLTAQRGVWSAHVAGGASRRLKPFLQPGTPVRIAYRSRLSDQLGAARVEAKGEGAAAYFDDPLALAALAAAAALIVGALPEREPHPGIFLAFEAFSGALDAPEVWPAVLVRFEMGLLAELGFGLDLTRCAATGGTDELIYVSPRTGRAVSSAAGEPYRDRLLALPGFLLAAQAGLAPGDIRAGLALTGHFLQEVVFSALHRPLPPARARLIERLEAAGRL